MYKNILLPIDLNSVETQETAIGMAIQIAKSFGAKLHVMAVVPNLGVGMVSAFFPEDYEQKVLAAAEAELQPIVTFDQTEFFDPADKSVSLHAQGHIYVPESCANGETCRLHIAFHGCRQHEDEIGDAFYSGAGYNEVAETNGIIVLYPQTTAWSDSSFFAYTENPRACWDWWGYSGDDYFRRSGKQIRAVARMINALTGEALLPFE